MMVGVTGVEEEGEGREDPSPLIEEADEAEEGGVAGGAFR